MNGRVSFVFLVVAVLAFACTRSRTSETLTNAKSQHKHGPVVASALDVRVDDAVHFALRVINEGDRKIELNFTNGMTHDFAVLDERGHQVWRWSDGRLFTSAYQNRVLRSDDTLSFNESWKPLTPGRYTAIARLASQNYPQEQRVTFAVR
jgi:hypothetical protein